MALIKAGAALVEMLTAHGVTHVFGLVGSSTMEVYNALYDSPEIAYIGAKDERAAAGMADGFARVTRRVGVVMAGQSGPGVTNLVSGLAAAKAAHSPVLSIGGAVSTAHWQLDGFQEVDQESLLQPVTKAVLAAYRGDRVADVVDRAIRLALSEPMGPVHVNLPRDVLAEPCSSLRGAGVPAVRRAEVLDPAAVDEAVAAIGRSRRPVLVAGAGVKWSGASDVVAALADLLSAPMATSAGHRDAVPNDHGMFLGQMGARGSELANEVIREADLVLGIGTRFGFNSTFFDPSIFADGATIIQSDVDPAALGRYVPAALTVQADSRGLAEVLLKRLVDASLATDTAWAATVRSRVGEMRAARSAQPDEGPRLDPEAFFHTLRDKLPRTAIVTLDAGTWCLKASELLDFYDPPSLLTPLDFASLGFAFPAAIGAQVGQPERRCVATIGDGGALFAISELSTLREYGIPVVLIIMDNQAWGAEKAYQKDFYESRFIGTDLPEQDFVAIARGFGVSARRAVNVAELGECLDEAFAVDEPRVITVQVNPDLLHSFRKDMFTSS